MVLTALNCEAKPGTCCWYWFGGCPAKVTTGSMVLINVDLVTASYKGLYEAAATMIIRKLAMFMNTAAFESQPILLKLRMMPEIMPIPRTMTIIAEKQTCPLEICAMLVVLLRIKTATVKNCWRDCATLMK